MACAMGYDESTASYIARITQENVNLLNEREMLIAGIRGCLLGLSHHPSDVPYNGCLISEASKEKLKLIGVLLDLHERERTSPAPHCSGAQANAATEVCWPQICCSTQLTAG